jgi:hypothetical protein
MADLGSTASLINSAFCWELPSNAYSLNRATNPPHALLEIERTEWELPRNAYSLNRVANPACGALIFNQEMTAFFIEDYRVLGGSISASDGTKLTREVRAIHRDGGVVARTMSNATGAFQLSVPPFAHLDVHIIAHEGDGCDLYLPQRTPIDV